LKKLKKGKKGNRKTNFIFWNFKDHKKWKIGNFKKKDPKKNQKIHSIFLKIGKRLKTPQKIY
jgi:hypothetical protein